jgi:hypothetical protein
MHHAIAFKMVSRYVVVVKIEESLEERRERTTMANEEKLEMAIEEIVIAKGQ